MSLRRVAADAASSSRLKYVCRACRSRQIHHNARRVQLAADHASPTESDVSTTIIAQTTDAEIELLQSTSIRAVVHRQGNPVDHEHDRKLSQHAVSITDGDEAPSALRRSDTTPAASADFCPAFVLDEVKGVRHGHVRATRHGSLSQLGRQRPSAYQFTRASVTWTAMRSNSSSAATISLSAEQTSTLETVGSFGTAEDTLKGLAESKNGGDAAQAPASKAPKKKKKKAKELPSKEERLTAKAARQQKAAAFSAKLQEAKIKELESKAKRLRQEIRARETAAIGGKRKGAAASGGEQSDTSGPPQPASSPSARASMKQQGVTEEGSVTPKGLTVDPVEIPQPPVPFLQHGLDRVLFNPGVYHLQDPISRVWNFDPYLEKLMPVAEFDFDSLKEYKTSSQDTALSQLAQQQNKKYIGSTSSMTTTLSQFHFLLSNFRPINFSMMSSGFMSGGKGIVNKFTKITKAPAAIFLRLKNGSYAIDYDKEYDSANVLMLLGKSLELLLTLPKSDYEIYRKSDPRTISAEQKAAPESYQYTTMGDFLMRSQLDAYDPRLPGNGTFDLKTRAVLPVRMDSQDYEPMSHYEIQSLLGLYNSYEREFYDMCRATMLKYMLQARMGRMTGIFVAYHNVTRMFGFQYLPIHEMDHAMHGQTHPCLGDQEFKASLDMLNRVFEKATAKFPGRSLRLHFEAKQSQEDNGSSSLHVFAEPMDESKIDEIQSTNKASVAEAERILMGRPPLEDAVQPEDKAAEQLVVESDVHYEADATVASNVDADAIVVDDAGDEEAVDNAESEENIEDEDAAVMEETEDETTDEAEDIEAAEDQVTPAESEASADELVATDLAFTETDSDSSEAVQQTEGSDVASTSEDADTAFLDRVEDLDANLNQDLFYATIMVQNTVNGSIPQHNRPKDLKSTDEWKIDYLIKDYKITSRVWALYEDVKQKRKGIFGREVEDADLAEGENDSQSKQLDFYIGMLRDKAAEGARYRAALDKLDASRERIVFETPLPKTNPDDVKVDDVGSYTDWLFSGKK